METIGEMSNINANTSPWSYTEEDFLTSTAPYEEVYKHHKNPFEHERLMAAMVKYAKTQGFTGFKRMYKSYCDSLRQAADTIHVDNTTLFSGQPLELDAGEWEADDCGITKQHGLFSVTACPHPVMPVERLVNIDTGVEKLKLAFRKGKNWREIIVEKSVLASAQKVTALADRGIAVTSETAKGFVQYISDLENRNYDLLPERKSIGRLGYIPGEGFAPYVEGLIFDGEASFRELFSAVRQQGSWETWLDVARRCRQMSTTARIILAASFASPLLEVLGALPFFVHLWGVDSGTGKTVALMLAASVWADPAVGAYVKTFDATVVGHEKTAAFLNHLPLCLDELQLAKDGRGRPHFDVYKLAQGVGRTRGNRAGGVDLTPTWRNCILTTGESPLTSSSAGAGAVNRVIDIECKADQAVITDGMSVANALRSHFGHGGKEFVARLYGIPGALETVRATYQELFKALSQRDTTEKQAMAAAAILVADKLASGWFFQDGQELTLEEMAAFLASKAAVSAGERGYRYLCDWVAQSVNRFQGAGKAGGDGTGSEVYGVIEDGQAFLIRSVFERVAADGGFSPAALLSWLKQNEKIRTRGRNLTRGKRIHGINVECVCLKLPGWEDIGGEQELLP